MQTFEWTFQVATDDPAQAISDACHTFFEGLTTNERQLAYDTLHVIAHPKWLPPCNCEADADQVSVPGHTFVLDL